MGAQQVGKLFGYNGFAEVVPLHFVTGAFLQEVHLLLRFHTFGHNSKAEGYSCAL